MGWLKESNRPAHLRCGISTAIFGTIMCSIGAAVGAEFKDWQYGGKFDFLDIAATVIGGVIGQVIQIVGGVIIWKCTEDSGHLWLLLCVCYWFAAAAVFVTCLPRQRMTRFG